MATAGLHHYLIEKEKKRYRYYSGNRRSKRNNAFCLIGRIRGTLINPYLAFDSVDYMLAKKLYLQSDKQEYIKNIIKALEKALLKTMAKMGISSVQSYRGGSDF